jgi:hypothetical protein
MKPVERSPPPAHTVPPLPNGECEVWKLFLQNGGCFSVNSQAGKEPKANCILGNKQQQVLCFVLPILNPVGENLWMRRWKNSQVRFHNLFKLIHINSLEAPRDLWEMCLPPKSKDWYEFASLLLMLCSALMPDKAGSGHAWYF